jgi:hypothetical protein
MKNLSYPVIIAVLFMFLSFQSAWGQPGCDSSFSFFRTDSARVALIPAAGHNLNEFYDTANGFTWEAWVYLKDTNYFETSLIAVEDSVLYEDIFLVMGWNGTGSKSQLTFLVSSNVMGWTVKVNGSTRLMPLRWYYVTAVCNYPSSTISLYLDGVNIGSTAIPFGPSKLTRNIRTSLGNLGSRKWYSFNGLIDEVKFWKGVRTPTDMLADSAGCTTFPQPNLVAYYRAREGVGAFTASYANSNFTGSNTARWGANAPAVCEPEAVIVSPSTSICDTSDSVSIIVNVSKLAPGSSWSVTLSDGSVITGVADGAGNGPGTCKVFPNVNTTYGIATMASNACAELTGGMDITVVQCASLNIGEASAVVNCNVYPNPNKGQFIIELDKAMGARLLAIVDVRGAIISRSVIGSSDTHFEISGLAAGVYNVVITGEGNVVTKRVVVSK